MMLESNEKELICKLIGGNKTVLDCGCGEGGIARLLAENGCEVIGVEIDPQKAKVADRWSRSVIVGDLESEQALNDVRRLGNSFDCILCSHVLEHLREPAHVLRNLQSLCRPGKGFFIIALPNVAYWQVRLSLLRGRWDYQDAGILDRTHLRFFTLHSAIEFLERSGLVISQIDTPTFRGPDRLHDLLRATIRKVTSPNCYAASLVFKCLPSINDGRIADE